MIIVGKNKTLSSLLAKKTGSNVVILDDGLQHRKLFRDIEIILLNCQNLFSNGYFLPRGLLRDSISRLKEADFIVLSNYNGSKEVKKEAIPFDVQLFLPCDHDLLDSEAIEEGDVHQFLR